MNEAGFARCDDGFDASPSARFRTKLERGDMRHSQHGLFIYDDDGLRDVPLTGGRAGRRAELAELYGALVEGKPVFHDGRWGMATLEVVLAIMQSGRERREIMLNHQVAVPEDYDADLEDPLAD